MSFRTFEVDGIVYDYWDFAKANYSVGIAREMFSIINDDDLTSRHKWDYYHDKEICEGCWLKFAILTSTEYCYHNHAGRYKWL